jgi:hypothetical protein
MVERGRLEAFIWRAGKWGTSQLRRFKRAPGMSGLRPIVLQNYFRPWTEERHSKLSSEQRILIQETAFSDSIIAHFGRSTAHWPTFATQSLRTPTFVRATVMSFSCQFLP